MEVLYTVTEHLYGMQPSSKGANRHRSCAAINIFMVAQVVSKQTSLPLTKRTPVSTLVLLSSGWPEKLPLTSL